MEPDQDKAVALANYCQGCLAKLIDGYDWTRGVQLAEDLNVPISSTKS